MSRFYECLKNQFENLRNAQIALDKCVAQTTSLMEQAAHLFSDLEHVAPVVAEEGSAIPAPAQFDVDGPSSPQWDMPNDAPMLGLEERAHTLPVSVLYDGAVDQPSFGTVSYE